MIFNSKITIYHRNKNGTWARFNYDKAWVYITESSKVDKGYADLDKIAVRLSYDLIDNLNVNDFKIGDIIVPQELKIDISRQQDLSDYNVYNISKINDNFYGINKHIHLSGL